jgi:hypothetical protein
MHRLLLARIEVWVLLLALILFVPGAILFASLSLRAERLGSDASLAERIALFGAKIPHNLAKFARMNQGLVAPDTAALRSKPPGWSFPAGLEAARQDAYLLLSRYDGTARRHVVELVDLATFTTVLGWAPDARNLLADVSRASIFPDYENWTRSRFRLIHPLPAPDGGLFVKDHYAPLMRLDVCGRRLWADASRAYHHSTERDAEGNLWVPSLAEPHVLADVPADFEEDELSLVSPSGEVLFRRSVPDLLIRAGLEGLIFNSDVYVTDPTHLNDIEPVLADGPYWNRGDVFLSLRNISTILLYRPSEDRILWHRTGPWHSQHDIDILDDHRISVYDNAVQDRGRQSIFPQGQSDLVVLDLATGTITRPLTRLFAAEAIETATAGLATALPGGAWLVEDTTNARLLLAAPTGEVLADYVNRAADGAVYHLGWSRLVPRARGDAMRDAAAKANCGGP